MPNAKIRTMQVRPIQSSDLSFEVAGILAKQNEAKARLGVRIPTPFDIGQKVSDWGKKDAGNPGRLFYDTKNISEALAADYLFTLRSDPYSANLEQIISQRELAYLEKFKHGNEIAKFLTEIYQLKVRGLDDLQRASGSLRVALQTAYEKFNRNAVIPDTVTTTTNRGDVTSTTWVQPVALKNTSGRIEVRDSPVPSNQTIAQTQVIPQAWEGNDWKDLKEKPDTLFKSQTTVSANDITQVSQTTNTEFRYPHMESLIQDLRTQLGLQDEMLIHKPLSFQAADMEQIIAKELEVIDWEVRKAQIRFAQTFLTSPLKGVVTAIYKDVGEAVQPGEPVVRIENDDELLVVGIVHYRGLITTANRVRLTLNNLYEKAGQSKTVEGPVVSVRGHDSDDDEWDIIFRCNNSDHALPLNYQFDRRPESTSIDIL